MFYPGDIIYDYKVAFPNLPRTPLPPSKIMNEGTSSFSTDSKPPFPLPIGNPADEEENLLKNSWDAGKCTRCGYRSDKKDRMQRHVQTVHLKLKVFNCNMCDFSSARKDKVKRHFDTVHSTEKRFKCDECEYATNRRDKLTQHTNHVHLGVFRPKKTHKKKKEVQVLIKDDKDFKDKMFYPTEPHPNPMVGSMVMRN